MAVPRCAKRLRMDVWRRPFMLVKDSEEELRNGYIGTVAMVEFWNMMNEYLTES